VLFENRERVISIGEPIADLALPGQPLNMVEDLVVFTVPT
jgi:hypothetical protein